MAISKIITSSLTDDAVTSAKIGTDQVGADALSSSAISGAVDIPANSVGQSELSIDLSAQSVPHIIPGVLYPGYDDKQIDGTTALAASTTGPGGSTVASSKYGTVQSDGRMYYYTDIKGSKPIKDPRIGAHFGSQRHKFKSLQVLEQETATEGENVYSVDGREWMRTKGDKWVVNYNINGNFIENSTASLTTDDHFIEIVGYFNDANLLHWLSGTGNDIFGVAVNGGTRQSNDFAISVASPLKDRAVDPASLLNLTFNATPTLGINTLRISNTNGAYLSAYGIELIAQDTSNRNNIQIPSQNVVSHGKKFTVSGTPHYNPFNNQSIGDTTSHGKNTVGWTTYDSTLDTTTSLGLDAWVDSGNYYRPVNGGRVVKWVDSSGNIKTSVNMMPPSAKAIGSHSGNSGPHQTAWTSTYQPVFSSGSIDHSLSEVAKTFHVREFGNGNVNGAEGGTYKDASMLWSTERDIAYVMDDGLSSFTASGVKGDENIYRNDTATFHCHTFIGTGISLKLHWGGTNTDIVEIAQNLPYGTHILKHDVNDSDSNTMDFTLDGVSLKTGHGLGNTPSYGEITYFQPKRPPIPEDACVLADYMLMADFVAIGASGNDKISKGVRFNSASRDFFADTSDSTLVLAQDIGLSFITGFKLYTSSSNANALTARLPSFGTNFVVRGYNIQQRSDLYLGTTDSAQTDANGNASYGYLSSNVALGVNNFVHKNTASQNAVFSGYEIATPIHTSSHYQAFETPFLNELVGGDRNMEQTNLVCSPDGKTWDEVTRDTSYIGNAVLKTAHANTHDNVVNIFDDWRGGVAGTSQGEYFNKDFAIAYDRMICLKEGNYLITFLIRSNKNDDIAAIKANGQLIKISKSTVGEVSQQTTVTINLKRGDYIQGFGVSGGGTGAYEILTNFQIVRL